jgi:hypothetical protein
MSTKLSLMLSGIVMLFSACDKLSTDVNLDLKQSVANIKLTLPAITDSMVNTEITLVEQLVYLNIDSVLTANGINKESIISIYLKDAVVNLNENQSVTDFSFVDYINLSFREESTAYKQVGSVTNAELAGNTTFSIKFPDSATNPDDAINLVDYFGKSKIVDLKDNSDSVDNTASVSESESTNQSYIPVREELIRSTQRHYFF